MAQWFPWTASCSHGGPSKVPTNGFKFYGWEMRYFDQEFGKELDLLFKEKFDLLLGHKTYDISPRIWFYDENPPRQHRETV